jgi:cell division septation protein DedD
VKGQARDELVRAMAEAGCSGAPTAGSGIVVTLAQRKPMGQGMNPANIVQVQYQPVNGAAATPPASAPVQQAQPEQPLQAAPISPQAQAVPPQAPQLALPVEQYAQPVQQQAAPAPAAPEPVAQFQQPQAPSDLSPEQQALLARLTGGPAAS